MSGAERVPSTELLSRQSDRRSISGNWLRPLSGDWPSAVCRALEWEPAVVRVVVAEARGSTPREPGTCMLVGLERVQGTIGGGPPRVGGRAVRARICGSEQDAKCGVRAPSGSGFAARASVAVESSSCGWRDSRERTCRC
ncbi:MAG: XdhC family protein [Gammaproteobacteria bacterium]